MELFISFKMGFPRVYRQSSASSYSDFRGHATVPLCEPREQYHLDQEWHIDRAG